MIKKIFTLFMTSCLFIFAFAGCAEKPEYNSKKPVTLTMWHNYGGDMQETMDLLIDEFNATVGKEKGIIINVTSISSGNDLNKSLSMIANDDPGAPEMPDIFTGYPKVAMQFTEKGMLVDLDNYIDKDTLSDYVDSFVEEGRISNGGLYVFPIAKSTEILYLNQTLFDEFSSETKADISKLSTFEGIEELSRLYFDWSGGKQFFAADSWFNVVEVGTVQLHSSLFDQNNALDLKSDAYRHIFETIYNPAVQGGFAIYDGYSSDLSKTGDLVCSTGSSAGVLFYGDTITYSDGTVKPVEYSILPYPVFENGDKFALQRGGGLMVAKSETKKEKAAAEFIKWLTATDQNMRFIEKTGYLPVTKQAFETELKTHLETLNDVRIRKILTAVLSMYDSYEFFTAPDFPELDNLSKSYDADFKKLLTEEIKEVQNGKKPSFANALNTLCQ